MKKFVLLLACLCVFCFSNVKEAKAGLFTDFLSSDLISADFKVLLIYMYAPRWLTVTVSDADGNPLEGERVEFNYSYREYFNFADGQPFNPIEQFPLAGFTKVDGKITFPITWCHGFVKWRDEVVEDGFGTPFKVYNVEFVESQSNTTNN